MAKKIRVYELARELGLTNKEALDICVALGIGVKSHSSSIEDAQADRARRKADAEGLRREVQPVEHAPTARDATKSPQRAASTMVTAGAGTSTGAGAGTPAQISATGEEERIECVDPSPAGRLVISLGLPLLTVPTPPLVVSKVEET